MALPTTSGVVVILVGLVEVLVVWGLDVNSTTANAATITMTTTITATNLPDIPYHMRDLLKRDYKTEGTRLYLAI